MDVYRMDFASSPGLTKPITFRHCRLEGDVLRGLARSPRPWVPIIDFPFGQAWRDRRQFFNGTAAGIDPREGSVANPDAV